MTREILHADLLGRNSFGVAATAGAAICVARSLMKGELTGEE